MARSRKTPVDKGNQLFLSKGNIRTRKPATTFGDKLSSGKSSGGGISKSSLRRQKRQARQNLSGGSLSRLLEALPSHTDDDDTTTHPHHRRRIKVKKSDAASNPEARLLLLARRAYLKNGNIVGRSKPLSLKTRQQIVEGEKQRFDKVLNYTASSQDNNNPFESLRKFISSDIGAGQLGLNSESNNQSI